jgi:hypothetical protein
MQSGANWRDADPLARAGRQGGGGYSADSCRWRYDVVGKMGPYNYVYWLGVTGTSSYAAYTAFELTIRCGR